MGQERSAEPSAQFIGSSGSPQTVGFAAPCRLAPRALALRRNFSAYDASYVALAEAFGCPLLTYDRRLAKAAANHCAVELLPLE
ncbi:type II toxin-antitoxin system VapC family toxin [Microbacterium sp. 2216-1]|uniref:type II toxin-antitoxin system VapC family toxin n=1 Tax=Microbacterium sp. 2216-1 TaxID=3390053 RepID=UPI0039767495